MTILETKVAVAQTMEQAQELVSLGIHEFQIQGRSGSTGEKWQELFFAPLMDAELAKLFRKCTGESYSGRDNVKDDDGFHAMVTEQGATVSQMAARFLDTIPKLLGFAGEAIDVVSA